MKNIILYALMLSLSSCVTINIYKKPEKTKEIVFPSGLTTTTLTLNK